MGNHAIFELMPSLIVRFCLLGPLGSELSIAVFSVKAKSPAHMPGFTNLVRVSPIKLGVLFVGDP